MSKTPFIVFGLFAALCLLGLPYLALSKEGGADAATVQVAAADTEAKEMFAANCGPCHTLAAAGSDGVVGPNLDDLLVPTANNSEETFTGNYSRILQAVACGREGRMPKQILEGEEAIEVAAFVAAYAGQIGKGPVVDLETAETDEPPTCN